MLIMWNTWKAWNNAKFNGVSPQGIIKSVLVYLWRLYRSRAMSFQHWKGDVEVGRKLGFRLYVTKPPAPKLVCWLPPHDELVKLNCDGASKGNPGEAGVGGLLRNKQGKLIFAYNDSIGHHSNIYVELCALVRGLELAKEFGYLQVWVEMDAQVVLHLINKEEGNWHLQKLLTKFRMLKRDMNLRLTHVYREGNQPADFLANRGCLLKESSIFVRAQGQLATLIRLDNLMPSFRF
ncbi:UNVERIFIED_CONTAM: putative ribonuclease H protein [Sesamum latifolium]|uniref:Ribonuclease H protein n=1 Tax=Sesamum latifolium TaxID=2727402 RepID=A0AAW2U2C7_9LAMI